MKRTRKKTTVLVHTYRINRNPIGIAPRLDFDVTQDHIDRAVPNCPSKCAVALALIDAGFEAPRMGCKGDGKLAVTKDGERWRYDSTPDKLVAATYAVDGGRKKKLKPFHVKTGFGFRHEYKKWTRERYAGGARRGVRVVARADKGTVGRTMRRQKLQAAFRAAGK